MDYTFLRLVDLKFEIRSRSIAALVDLPVQIVKVSPKAGLELETGTLFPFAPSCVEICLVEVFPAKYLLEQLTVPFHYMAFLIFGIAYQKGRPVDFA